LFLATSAKSRPPGLAGTAAPPGDGGHLAPTRTGWTAPSPASRTRSPPAPGS